MENAGRGKKGRGGRHAISPAKRKPLFLPDARHDARRRAPASIPATLNPSASAFVALLVAA